MESRRVKTSVIVLLIVLAFPLLNGCAVVSDVQTAADAIFNLQKSRQKRNQIATTMDDRPRRAQ